MTAQPNFETYGDLLPPQNIDAEESILGGILLDAEAMGRVADLLSPEAFYLSTHRHIFEAMVDLSRRGNPTDLVTVTAWLRDRDLLDKVGGPQKLTELLDRTVSAVNIDRYASLVAEKYVRRKLIAVGGDIAQLAFDNRQELGQILDAAEQKLFNVTQSDIKQDLVSAEEVLSETFLELESRSMDASVPGLTCDFYDLDTMTQGFQRSDLVIVAGRPSMGKTSFVLNVARNLAEINNLPVAIFSLEMSKEQLVYRLLSSEAQIETGRLRSGRIGEHEWAQIGSAISRLSTLKVFIDDTPNITVNEMRSKCRRLQAESGGALGMVILDYLQLMEGGGDNRVQELSKITRSLKGLARELNVPVLALSQLSRGVESRTDKRPVMSDLRECVTGDTLVCLADGRRTPIAELVGQTPTVISMNVQGKLVSATAEVVWEVGTKPIYQLTTASGYKIKATGKHRIYTLDGWRSLASLEVGHRIAVASHIPQLEPAADPWPVEVLQNAELTDLANSDLFWDEVVAIDPAGEAPVYDLTVPGPASWLADGVVSHNSGSIEQDADLIVMLYREEYYNPDTPDRGISEVLIKKHRNGPTGTVKLLFEPQYTRFRNLAGGQGRAEY